MPNYVTSTGSNSIPVQLAHLRFQGIYQSGGVPDSPMEQSWLLQSHSKYPSKYAVCSPDDTNLKLLDRVVSGASFLNGSVFCVTLHIVDLWQYCVYMLYKIRSNPTHPLKLQYHSILNGTQYIMRPSSEPVEE